MKYNKKTRELWEVKEHPVATLSSDLEPDCAKRIGAQFSYAQEMHLLLQRLVATSGDIREIIKIIDKVEGLIGQIHNREME